MKKTKVARTSAGLRNALFDEIDKLREGDGDPQAALAVAGLARNIIAIAKLEYQVAQDDRKATPIPIALGETPKEDEPSFVLPPSKERLMGGR